MYQIFEKTGITFENCRLLYSATLLWQSDRPNIPHTKQQQRLHRHRNGVRGAI